LTTIPESPESTPGGVTLNVSESKADRERMMSDSIMLEQPMKLVNHEIEAEMRIEAFDRFVLACAMIGAFATTALYSPPGFVD
jgi:hypothetical protein